MYDCPCVPKAPGTGITLLDSATVLGQKTTPAQFGPSKRAAASPEKIVHHLVVFYHINRFLSPTPVAKLFFTIRISRGNKGIWAECVLLAQALLNRKGHPIKPHGTTKQGEEP